MTPSRDIVVVGAGIIGCAVAYELARRGASVEIIDDRGPGMGATHASAGMLAPFNEARDGGPLLDIAARSLELFDTFVGRVSHDASVALTYDRSGTLDLALRPETLPLLEQTRAILAGLDVDCEWLTPSSVREHEPAITERVAGGLFISRQGFVAAAELTRALAAAARRHGARIIEHGRVKRIEARDGELAVVTDRGALAGDSVVLAAGSWSGQIDVQGVATRIPVTPVRGQLLQLQWTGTPLSHVVWSERCYVVPWRDRTVLIGATVEDVGFDERTTVAGVADLLSAVSELTPVATQATFVGARAGLRPAAPDHLPVIGRSSALPQLVYATGHYRNGVLLAPLTAQLVADLLLNDRADPLLDTLSPQRFGAL